MQLFHPNENHQQRKYNQNNIYILHSFRRNKKDLVLFASVLWHINYGRLFNAKSSLYIYIEYIWFGLVGFYSISTIVGYLMLNPFYTYISNIYDLVWFGFMAYQPLQVIRYWIFFIHT